MQRRLRASPPGSAASSDLMKIQPRLPIRAEPPASSGAVTSHLHAMSSSRRCVLRTASETGSTAGPSRRIGIHAGYLRSEEGLECRRLCLAALTLCLWLTLRFAPVAAVIAGTRTPPALHGRADKVSRLRRVSVLSGVMLDNDVCSPPPVRDRRLGRNIASISAMRTSPSNNIYLGRSSAIDQTLSHPLRGGWSRLSAPATPIRAATLSMRGAACRDPVVACRSPAR